MGTEGRWLTTDPYRGSYDWSDPQSLNRYGYVGGRAMWTIDPSGLDPGVFSGGGFASGCGGMIVTGGQNPIADFGCIWSSIKMFFMHPKFRGSLKPRPSTPLSDKLGMPGGWSPQAGNLGDVLGIGTPGCDFGACGDIGNALEKGAGATANSFCSKHPTICNWANYLATHPIFISVNEIGAGQITYQHATKTICANVGLGPLGRRRKQSRPESITTAI
jgi:hypothetical protein